MGVSGGMRRVALVTDAVLLGAMAVAALVTGAPPEPEAPEREAKAHEVVPPEPEPSVCARPWVRRQRCNCHDLLLGVLHDEDRESWSDCYQCSIRLIPPRRRD